MPNQSLARIMFGSSQEYSLAVVTHSHTALRTNLPNPEGSHSVPEPETIAQLLSKAWDRLFHKR
jgi:hypothetical protein